MTDNAQDYLTTKELAELLRIKERKVYDLVASGEVPCSRATGKLLFSRNLIEAWLATRSTGPKSHEVTPRPDVFLGSHDPLLEWALRESHSGLALFFDGSNDGLKRFASRAGLATGLHLLDEASGDWNVKAVRESFSEAPVVLLEWAWRQRGLMLRQAEKGTKTLAQSAQIRFVPRQEGAGSQRLLIQLMRKTGINVENVKWSAPARTESDAALALREGKADVAFGLEGIAQQYGLGFQPIIRERFDILVERRAWFEAPLQRLATFTRTPEFQTRAQELRGYDVSTLGTVHFNGP